MALSDAGGTPFDGAACPSLAAYCGSTEGGGAALCVPDWAAAQSAATWCTTEAGAPYLEGYADVFMQTDAMGSTSFC